VKITNLTDNNKIEDKKMKLLKEIKKNLMEIPEMKEKTDNKEPKCMK
jgi:hypothetical protein